MARRRDTVQELLDMRARNKGRTRPHIFHSRFKQLNDALKAGGFKDELMRYFPVGLIALVEAFFRSVYGELINLGEPYASRAEPLLKRIEKLDWRAIRAIEGRSTTSGEMVAHLLPLSSLDAIKDVMDTLLGGEDFLERLRNMPNHMYPLGEISRGVTAKAALPEPDETFKYVARTFELRHIFCHEAAMEMRIDPEEIGACVKHCGLFLNATESLMVKVYYPQPLTMVEMREQADRECRESMAALETTEKQLQGLVAVDGRQRLEEAQRKWKESSEADAAFDTHLWVGGSGHGMAIAWALKEDADARREKLQKYVEEFSN